MKYKHEANLDKKIAEAKARSLKKRDLKSLKDKYEKYRRDMLTIDYSLERASDFNTAAKLIDDYLSEIDTVEEKHSISAQAKLRSSALEEISLYLFANNQKILSGELQIFNDETVYAGVVVDKGLSYKLLEKKVDFCIGKKSSVTIEHVEKQAKFPFVCVEVKTYLDATMSHDVLFSGTQIKTASPDAKTFVLMEYENEISEKHPIPAVYAYAIDKMYNLRDCARPSGKKKGSVVVTPISGIHLLEYYKEITSAIK